jgi:hypothetical protein
MLQLIKSGVNEVLGDETSDGIAEYAEGVDVYANAVKYDKHTADDITDDGCYRRLCCFGNRQEQMQA